MHIVTHTNASPGGGCPSSTNRLEVLYQDANDKTLADLLVSYLDPATPGSARTVRRTDLAELGTNRPWGDAYVELQFHDNEAGQSWIYNSIETATYRYGVAVDQLLNYP